MNVIIFDTETVNLQKPYMYNLGYIIYDTDGQQVLCEKEFVIEQVWNNRPLFDSAYYASKRPLYISGMRGRKITLAKYGHVMSKLINDIKKYQVDGAYAFNSAFDEKVFEFNADYYHCRNGLDGTPIFDIRAYACNNERLLNALKKFADGTPKEVESKFFTDADGYKTTAESFTCMLKNDYEYNEEHTALADSRIELEVLKECLTDGMELNKVYDCPRSFPRSEKPLKKLTIKVDGQVAHSYDNLTSLLVRKGSSKTD